MMKNGSKIFLIALILCVAVFTTIFFLRICGISIPGLTDDRWIPNSNSLNFCALELNAASAEELDEIPGVGTALAKAIVDYRDKYGNYVDMDELLHIRGMSKELYQVITRYVHLGGTS